MKKSECVAPLPVKQITVLLAEDHAGLRKSLKWIIELDGDIKVAGEAKNGCEAVRLALHLYPEVVVMDIAMPSLNGLQATKQIMEAAPATRVLILSAHPDQEYIEQAMILGASGYLIKPSSTHVLAEAVREAQKGNAYFSLSISKQLRDQCQKVFGRGELLKRRMAHRALSDASSPHYAAPIQRRGRNCS
ncbi:MAG: response regulator transcription factor [Methylacidiphilales bacterium]|nr:response regulator transcription factor [Candidatus Methylacidiphilales bacterium]